MKLNRAHHPWLAAWAFVSSFHFYQVYAETQAVVIEVAGVDVVAEANPTTEELAIGSLVFADPGDLLLGRVTRLDRSTVYFRLTKANGTADSIEPGTLIRLIPNLPQPVEIQPTSRLKGRRIEGNSRLNEASDTKALDNNVQSGWGGGQRKDYNPCGQRQAGAYQRVEQAVARNDGRSLRFALSQVNRQCADAADFISQLRAHLQQLQQQQISQRTAALEAASKKNAARLGQTVESTIALLQEFINIKQAE